LRQFGPAGNALADDLLEDMFAGLDAALREMGVGDLSVPKKMRALAANYYGRASVYERCLTHDDNSEFDVALLRNVYSGQAPKEAAAALSRYCRRLVGHLEALTLDNFSAGTGMTEISESAHEG
jgi:cytochrome b pre-mRNA-processing protein 3